MHPAGTAYCPNLGTQINLDQSLNKAISQPTAAPVESPLVSPSIPAVPTASTPAPATTAAEVAAAATETPQVITTKAIDSDRAAGIKVVTVPRVTTYHMPGICVACGKPLNGSNAKIKASVQQTSGNLRTTLSLDFPLCSDCNSVQQTFTKISNKALGIAAAIIGPLAVIFVIVGLLTVKSSSDQGGIWGGAICGGFILWMVVYGIIQAVLNKKQPEDVQKLHNLIGKSVGITGFTSTNVTFKFASESFATMFSALNTLNQDLINSVIQNLINKKT